MLTYADASGRMLCVRQLSATSPQWLASACDRKLLTLVEKLQVIEP